MKKGDLAKIFLLLQHGERENEERRFGKDFSSFTTWRKGE